MGLSMKKLNLIGMTTATVMAFATLFSTGSDAGVRTMGTVPGSQLSNCVNNVKGYTPQNLSGKWFGKVSCTLTNDANLPISSVDTLYLDFTDGTTLQTNTTITVTYHAHLCLTDWHGGVIACGADSTLVGTLAAGATNFRDFALSSFNNLDTTGIDTTWSYWTVEMVGIHTASFAPQGSFSIWGIGLGAP
jgi:hypothetical protein